MFYSVLMAVWMFNLHKFNRAASLGTDTVNRDVSVGLRGPDFVSAGSLDILNGHIPP